MQSVRPIKVCYSSTLPELSPKALEVLRELMEAGYIEISRAWYQVRLPASFQLVAAMYPCPCDYFGESQRECRCTSEKVKLYRQRVSGPLIVRIDLQVEVPRLSDTDKAEPLQQNKSSGPNSECIREQVIKCRARQLERSGYCNARHAQHEVQELCVLSMKDRKLLTEAMERQRFSVRAYFRILKIARTIADLADEGNIGTAHLMESINYRRFDAG